MSTVSEILLRLPKGAFGQGVLPESIRQSLKRAGRSSKGLYRLSLVCLPEARSSSTTIRCAPSSCGITWICHIWRTCGRRISKMSH